MQKRIKKRFLRQMNRPTIMSFVASQMAVENVGEKSKITQDKKHILLGVYYANK